MANTEQALPMVESIPQEPAIAPEGFKFDFGKSEKRAGNTVAFLCSLVFHVTLLLLLASCMYVAGKPSEGLLLSADIGASTETAVLDSMQSFELSPDVSSIDETTVEIEAPVLALNVELNKIIDEPKALGTSGISATLTSLTVGDVVQNLQAQSKERGASFFGAYAEGNRFVYVLDSSRSMTGDRWAYACNQLIDSLNGLKPGQEFFVICFDLQTTFLFNLLPQNVEFFESDRDTITKVKRWLRSRTLGRATKPAQALGFALDFNPDAIFLLSDGELQDNSQMMLRMNNGVVSERRQIPVHTVHLFSMQGRNTLQQIARENGGTFTPIEGHTPFGRFRRR